MSESLTTIIQHTDGTETSDIKSEIYAQDLSPSAITYDAASVVAQIENEGKIKRTGEKP